MFYKKSFSRVLLSLFAFNALNGVVPISAMEIYESENSDTIDRWAYEMWCWNYSFDPKINKNYENFMVLLKQHEQLFNNCGITLKENIKDIYKEIFKNVYNYVSGNGLFMLNRPLGNVFIPWDILKKYTSVDGGLNSKTNFNTKDEHGVKFPSYSYNFPCTCGNKEGNLVLTISLAQTMLRSVDLKFEPKIV